MTVLDAVLSDLAVESLQLDEWVAGLPAARWETVTTAEGWTVRHQIAHLHWTDTTSVAAIVDQSAFGAMLKMAVGNPSAYVDTMTEKMALTPTADLLPLWRDGRAELDAVLRSVPAGEKVPWFGPPMSPASMATARVMETWAHSHDVGEALGLPIPQTARAKHACHLGVRARGFAYLVRGETDPGIDIRVELTGPDGDLWAWGPAEAPERVTGSGYDFALLATRRRHPGDVDVHADGDNAAHWLTIVQAFAGLPGGDPVRLADR